MVVTGSIQHIMLLKDFQLPTASIIKKKKKKEVGGLGSRGKRNCIKVKLHNVRGRRLDSSHHSDENCQ